MFTPMGEVYLLITVKPTGVYEVYNLTYLVVTVLISFYSIGSSFLASLTSVPYIYIYIYYELKLLIGT